MLVGQFGSARYSVGVPAVCGNSGGTAEMSIFALSIKLRAIFSLKENEHGKRITEGV